MPKKKALIRVKNDEEKDEFETNIIIQDGILKYKDKDNATMIIDFENNKLIRENNKLKIEIPFSLSNRTTGIIKIKDINKQLNVEVKTKKIKQKDNNIEIEYEIENQRFLYCVEEIK